MIASLCVFFEAIYVVVKTTFICFLLIFFAMRHLLNPFFLLFIARSFGRGKIELGVHIADVTYFVKPGSLTDAEARSRYRVFNAFTILL